MNPDEGIQGVPVQLCVLPLGSKSAGPQWTPKTACRTKGATLMQDIQGAPVLAEGSLERQSRQEALGCLLPISIRKTLVGSLGRTSSAVSAAKH